MIDSFLHPEKGYEAAAKQMQDAWRQAQAAQEPFRQAGQGQLPILQGAESNLMDPSALLAKWMSSYQESPFAKRSFDTAKSAGLDAASSMGLEGSSAALGNIEQSAGDIMGADRSKYLDDLMNKYMKGIGIGQDIYNTGAATAGNLGGQGLRVGDYMGGSAFGAQNAPGELFKQLMAMMGKAAMASQGAM